MMAPVAPPKPVVLTCKGTQRNGKRCSYVFGKSNGDFEGKCPKCHSLLTHFHERVAVFGKA